MGGGKGGWKGGGGSWDQWDSWDTFDSWDSKGNKGGKNQPKGGKADSFGAGDKGNNFGAKGKGGKDGKDGKDGAKGFDGSKGGPPDATSMGASTLTKASSKALPPPPVTGPPPVTPTPPMGMTMPGQMPPPGGAPMGKGAPPLSGPQGGPGMAMPGMPPMGGKGDMPMKGKGDMQMGGKGDMQMGGKGGVPVSAKSSSFMPGPGGAPGQPQLMPPPIMAGKGSPMGPGSMPGPMGPGPAGPGAMPRPPQMLPPPPGAPGDSQPRVVPPPPGAMPPRPPGGHSLPQQLQQLVAAGASGGHHGGGMPPNVAAFQPEKKPQLFMLVAQLAASVEEAHIQQVLEQCGDVQAFRRGKDGEGKPMSFGVAQFSDAEAAWKASTCLSKRVIGGQEVKVLLEENTENFINKWKTSQKPVLRVNTDEELEWELERKAVSCKALIDAKLEELYGATEGTNAAAAQRRNELREREAKRVERSKKRKAWREAEFAKELDRLEASEKSLRTAERKKDNTDREREENDVRDKVAKELKLEKLEADGGATSVNISQLADNRALMDLVDKVQEEPREDLFTIKMDPAYLRNERILERKLRPWLEKKIDLYMGGQTSDLVEHIIRRINGASSPDPLIAELERFLDEFAEPLVERLWRMLALELTQDGLVLPSVAKKAKKEEMKEEKLFR